MRAFSQNGAGGAYPALTNALILFDNHTLRDDHFGRKISAALSAAHRFDVAWHVSSWAYRPGCWRLALTRILGQCPSCASDTVAAVGRAVEAMLCA